MTTLTIPKNAEELEEALNDQARMKTLLEKPENLKDFMQKYAEEFWKADNGVVATEVRHQMTEVLKEMYEKNEVPDALRLKRPPMNGEAADGRTGGRMGMYKHLDLNRKQLAQIAATGTGPGVEVSGFEHMTDFLKAISPHVTRQQLDMNVLKVLGEGQGDQGGFLVPEEFRAELLSLALEMAIVRPRARVLPMAGLTVKIPTIRDTTHATNVHGGVQGFWVPESGSITISEPTFGQAMLTAKKLTGLTRITNELLRDSAITLEPLINQMFASALAYFEDDAFIAGIGGGQPVGILNADALVSVAKESGQAATTLVVENVIKMFSRLLPSSAQRAVWIMHPDVQPELYTMSLSVGTGGAPMFFPAGGIGGAPVPTLLGRPVLFSEKCETLGTAGDVYLVDLDFYLIGDRQAIEMAVSEHTRFATDESDFRVIQRVDGRPWLESAQTPRNGSNTLSPFIALATRS